MRETFTKGSLRRRIGIAVAAVAAAGAVAVPGVAWASTGNSTDSSRPVAMEQDIQERPATASECAQAMVPATEVTEEEAAKMRAEEAAGTAEGTATTASTPATQVTEEEAAKMRAEEAAAGAVSC
ncbi:hypothetical protein [Prescottella agglutinans]|uniref:Uncharacterized protein n=1 Tax=Prescottella agglutinans TaxID=1644129 RepID=A0ABT6MG61_9NOCA|nr:hypothetical protein [Prescottella agglutinans]MDH6283267.1 hypothetical protein [Prescottella agglutinans]